MLLNPFARTVGAFGLALGLALTGPAIVIPSQVEAFAQQRMERLTFSRGASSKTVRGTVRGYDSVVYRVGATAGQTLSISMRGSNASSYFNVTADSASEALFNGSINGNSMTMQVPSSGDYLVEVYLMRNAARRNERSDFSLTVRITGSAAYDDGGNSRPRPDRPDFADGMDGGPDVWRVFNVPQGDQLNIRSAPSSQATVVARANNGARLNNLGCRMSGSTRWCRVEGRDGTIGWAAGRFLRE